MKLGIMQPYFFPYIGYFALIANTDNWVVFDITQYTPKTWINRNRVLHPNNGWQYITVPLSNSSINIKISEAKILSKEKSSQRILAQIEHYKKNAPYFQNVKKIIEKTFNETSSDYLIELNINSLKNICEYLEINFNYIIASKHNFTFHNNMKAGDWALEIASQLGANEYINPEGGKDLFNEKDFLERGIKLTILTSPKFEYECKNYNFEDRLSIIDVLMWNKPEDVRKIIS
ncbi:MAG: WbqC family protein [Rickettsiales bacterium]|nr:WbqC family protein [Rickettsiales bacterium]